MPGWGPWPVATTATRRMACSAEKRPNLGLRLRLNKPTVIEDGLGQRLHFSPRLVKTYIVLESYIILHHDHLSVACFAKRRKWAIAPGNRFLRSKFCIRKPLGNQRSYIITVTRPLIKHGRVSPWHPWTAQQDAPIFVSGWKLFRCRSLFRLLWRVLRSKGHGQWSAGEFLCFLGFWLNKILGKLTKIIKTEKRRLLWSLTPFEKQDWWFGQHLQKIRRKVMKSGAIIPSDAKKAWSLDAI